LLDFVRVSPLEGVTPGRSVPLASLPTLVAPLGIGNQWRRSWIKPDTRDVFQHRKAFLQHHLPYSVTDQPAEMSTGAFYVTRPTQPAKFPTRPAGQVRSSRKFGG